MAFLKFPRRFLALALPWLCCGAPAYQADAIGIHGSESVNRDVASEEAASAHCDYLRCSAMLDAEFADAGARAELAVHAPWTLEMFQVTVPRNWRHEGIPDQAAASTAPDTMLFDVSSSSAFTCGSKRVCKEMSSCDEAYFYLNQCGLQRLDRDHDGIPCEAICR